MKKARINAPSSKFRTKKRGEPNGARRSRRSSVRVVLVTSPNNESAESMARILVEEKLAACVNILPAAISVYRWEGAIQRDEEKLMIIKTTSGALSRVEMRVLALHPYSTPEFVVLAADHVSEAYGRWLRSAVEAPPLSPRRAGAR